MFSRYRFAVLLIIVSGESYQNDRKGLIWIGNTEISADFADHHVMDFTMPGDCRSFICCRIIVDRVASAFLAKLTPMAGQVARRNHGASLRTRQISMLIGSRFVVAERF